MTFMKAIVLLVLATATLSLTGCSGPIFVRPAVPHHSHVIIRQAPEHPHARHPSPRPHYQPDGKTYKTPEPSRRFDRSRDRDRNRDRSRDRDRKRFQPRRPAQPRHS